MNKKILNFLEHQKKKNIFKNMYFALCSEAYNKALLELKALELLYKTSAMQKLSIGITTAVCHYKKGSINLALKTLKKYNVTYMINLVIYHNRNLLLWLEDLTRDHERLKQVISTLDLDLECLSSALENTLSNKENPTAYWFINSAGIEMINKYLDITEENIVFEMVDNILNNINPLDCYDIDYHSKPKLKIDNRLNPPKK